MIDKISINGTMYAVTPVPEGEQPSGSTVTVDGVTYLIGTAITAPAEMAQQAIEKIQVNGVLYDIADVEAVVAEKNRATEAERMLRDAINTNANNLAETEKNIANQLFATPAADKVTITGRNKQSMRLNFEADIPAATTETAGVMTAEDKKMVNASIKNIDVSPNAGDVELDLEDNAERTFHVVFPEATAEHAGVMTAKDKKTIDSLETAIAEGEKRALRRLFIAAGAEYNDSSADKTKTAPWGETVIHKAGHYYLNGLGDITEEQMMRIYNRGHFNDSDKTPFGYGTAGSPNAIRTNLTRVGLWNASIEGSYLCISNTTIEILALHVSTNDTSTCAVYFQNISSAFDGATKLSIIDIRAMLSCDVWYTSAFNKCYELREVRIRNLKSNLNFKDSSKISKASILFAIQNSQPSSAITITLHPDAYARLNPDLEDNADIKSALEAQPLITLASA
jgi:hypothetical protein